MRQRGQFSQAKLVYDQAIAALKKAWAADPRHPEVRSDLAITTDARGSIHRELGDVKAAEQDYRGALAVLDDLLAEFPTRPRYRESLARVCNSLGLIDESTGRLSDAEAYFRSELRLVERLSQDFPDRPEHKRELAWTLMNLGTVLGDRGRLEDAEAALVRSIDLDSAIAAANPRDVQVGLDLAKSHAKLGELLRAGVRFNRPFRLLLPRGRSVRSSFTSSPTSLATARSWRARSCSAISAICNSRSKDLRPKAH